MMKHLWFLTVVVTALSGCRTGVYTTTVAPDEYQIRGTSAGGMYGGFIGTAPSADALKDEAEQLCPAGYDKTYEKAGTFSEGKFLEWHIRCHSRAPS